MKVEATDAAVRSAYAQVTAARKGLGAIDSLLKASDFKGAASALGAPPYSSFKETLLVLVQGLGPAEKKAIGTDRTYGLGADASIMLGGLAAEVGKGDAAAARGFVERAGSTLDEIIVASKALK